ncbi:MaoC family dehydratase [Duganella sp. Root1480D1]|uniref:MaoC family dehydratase n=1 Tax=Duganella sp. Root1480D1 TaxID=1736471 RepID=UPI00070B3FAF|nr:MaoC family dehydratase [Duganella sp. Root1480D1]KQZ26908.1 dehydratase [Duganella sp. Root1480D1]
MARLVRNVAELEALAGQEVGVSGWVDITQERVNTFGVSTNDEQWIHTDPARAAAESPYGGTVAHGFLTLSLLPGLLQDAVFMEDMRMGVNYGLDKVRFPAPVPVGSRVRGRVILRSITPVAGGHQLAWEVTVECEGSEKPACVAEFLMRRYP